MSPTVEDVRAAQQANRHGERCRYAHVGKEEDFHFPDETFDFVHCGTFGPDEDGGHARHVIVETVRVLRLLGIAVVEVAGGDEPLPLEAAGSRLDARLSAPPEGPSSAAGEPTEVTIEVTNMGVVVLGSPIYPLTLEAHWDRQPRTADPAAVAELGPILLPGDSVTVSLVLTTPATPGTHMLGLSLVSSDPWAERRSPATVVKIDVDEASGPGGRVVALDVDASPPGGSDLSSAVPGLRPDELVPMVVADADAVVLSAQWLPPGSGALPRQRYFFARA